MVYDGCTPNRPPSIRELPTDMSLARVGLFFIFKAYLMTRDMMLLMDKIAVRWMVLPVVVACQGIEEVAM